jgi:hypothetical protein
MVIQDVLALAFVWYAVLLPPLGAWHVYKRLRARPARPVQDQVRVVPAQETPLRVIGWSPVIVKGDVMDSALTTEPDWMSK